MMDNTTVTLTLTGKALSMVLMALDLTEPVTLRLAVDTDRDRQTGRIKLDTSTWSPPFPMAATIEPLYGDIP